MKKIFVVFCFLSLLSLTVFGQKDQYKVGAIGFYNLENLFDTLDTPNVRDHEFTPNGSKSYNGKMYKDKLTNLSSVIAKIGTDMTPDGLSILGVCEIENRSVLEDLVRTPDLVNRNYQIVHYDSWDKRGIDVALIYQEKYFKVENSRKIRLKGYTKSNGDSLFTRDILFVSGLFDEEPLHIFVNHWPSRSGGEKASAPNRNNAAKECRVVIDSLLNDNAAAKIIVMGDLNDDPDNDSVRKYIRAQRDLKKIRKGEMYNPMFDYYKKGIGTTAYRDAWSLFDQIILSKELTKKRNGGYFFYQAKVFNEKSMTQRKGQYKGYPLRAWVGDKYMGGYSDHFPVYVYLVKKI